MNKVIKFILEEVPVEYKKDIKVASRYIQNKTPRIIYLFDEKSQLLVKGTLKETIDEILSDSNLKNLYDETFAKLLLAHMILYFNSQVLSKGEKLPLDCYFKHLLEHQTYGMSKETIKKYL